jgi:hypothetical protein
MPKHAITANYQIPEHYVGIGLGGFRRDKQPQTMLKCVHLVERLLSSVCLRRGHRPLKLFDKQAALAR